MLIQSKHPKPFGRLVCLITRESIKKWCKTSERRQIFITFLSLTDNIPTLNWCSNCCNSLKPKLFSSLPFIRLNITNIYGNSVEKQEYLDSNKNYLQIC